MPDQTSSEALMLPGGDEFRPALTLGSDCPYPPQRNGKPCFYYWKESLPVGTFFDANGREFTVANAEVDEIVETLRLARTRGFEPCAPSSHRVTEGKNYGYIIDARRNGKGNLELLHQFIGEESRDEALTKKTSICLLRNATDEHGNRYRLLVDHNAVLPNPRLSQLQDFVPALAASRGQATTAAYFELADPTRKVVPTMDLTNLRNLVGAAANATDDQVILLAQQQIETLRGDKTALSTDLAAARTKIEDLGTQPPPKPKIPDADAMDSLRRSFTSSRDEAIKCAGAEIVSKAQKQYLGIETFNPDHLTLDRVPVPAEDAKTAEGLRQCIRLFDMLKHAKPPIVAGPRTTGQGAIELARREGEEDKPMSKERRKELLGSDPLGLQILATDK